MFHLLPSFQRTNRAKNSLICLLLIVLGSGLVGCASNQSDPLKEGSAQELYQAAHEAMEERSFLTAIQKLEALEARYPFGPFAQQAQLDLIYCYYESDNPAAALASADRFIRINPNHPFVDYAYYMRGLVNFNADKNVVQKLFNTDFSRRDAGAARQAFQDFGELVRRFPESQYASDARQRMVYLRNNLAQYELHVARYYMQREAYVAAANRAQYVVEHFPNTPAISDALIIMAKAYTKLDLPDLAEKTKRTIELNYPKEFAKLSAK